MIHFPKNPAIRTRKPRNSNYHSKRHFHRYVYPLVPIIFLYTCMSDWLRRNFTVAFSHIANHPLLNLTDLTLLIFSSTCAD